jgi:CubicO group peptidase (beta-lactamase class C family)
VAADDGKLSREELIRVAGEAKPSAKLGEKFQYQNIMYAAAGEVVAKAENSTWDKLIATRIFKPLGMTNSDTTAPRCKRRATTHLILGALPLVRPLAQKPQGVAQTRGEALLHRNTSRRGKASSHIKPQSRNEQAGDFLCKDCASRLRNVK